MKLERFKEKNNKKRNIIIFTVSCIMLITGVFLYQSYALFETKENFNFVEGDVNDPGDIYFAYYINDQLTYEMPGKNSGYTLASKSNCTNGVTLSWDDLDWKATIYYQNYQKETNSRVKCNLYFEEKRIPTFEETKAYLISKGSYWDLVEDDETADHNLRYIGVNPNNYIDIGDRDADGNIIPWRIIGIMNNVDDGTGKKESRIKVVRSSSIGSFSWDSSDKTINAGFGVNEWSQADIMKLLNQGYENESVGGSLYWNRESGSCYNEFRNSTGACDFTKNGLSEDAKSVIANAVWNTGSNGTENAYEVITSKIYELERSNYTGKICTSEEYCNDNVVRNTIWTGKIGLISASDYGYSIGNYFFGFPLERWYCLEEKLNLRDEICRLDSWLFGDGVWTMMPLADSTHATNALRIGQYGDISSDATSKMASIYPAAYLSHDVGIMSGKGSLDDMFKIIKK